MDEKHKNVGDLEESRSTPVKPPFLSAYEQFKCDKVGKLVATSAQSPSGEHTTIMTDEEGYVLIPDTIPINWLLPLVEGFEYDEDPKSLYERLENILRLIKENSK